MRNIVSVSPNEMLPAGVFNSIGAKQTALPRIEEVKAKGANDPPPLPTLTIRPSRSSRGLNCWSKGRVLKRQVEEVGHFDFAKSRHFSVAAPLTYFHTIKPYDQPSRRFGSFQELKP